MFELLQRLANGPVICMDGALNTELSRRGMRFTTSEWLRANLDAPETVASIHRAYSQAGAQMHIANSFSGARHVLQVAGLGAEFESINRAAVELCRDAVGTARHTQWIAGSISTYATDHDRRKLPAHAEHQRNVADQAAVLANAGADLIALEMLFDVDTTIAMMNGAFTVGLPVSIGLVFVRDDSGRVLLYGTGRDGLSGHADIPAREALARIIDHIPADAVALVTVMHSEAEDTAPAFELVNQVWGGATALYPNTGRYHEGGWDIGEAQSPEDFAENCALWAANGARIVGGCCGYGPEHIAAMCRRLDTEQ